MGNSTGFIGAGNGTFVGERMAGATGMSTTQRPSFGSLGAGRGGSDFNTQNQPGQGASANRTFRPQYRIGFKYTRAAADVSQRTAAVVSRFTTRNPGISGLEVVVNEAGIAEIRGTAPTDDARLLIENVVRLEPGVRSIKNLIVVTPASPPPSSP